MSRSSRANDAKAVSGALLVYGEVFIQALEGDHASVKPLFERIEADPRHQDVALKGVEPLERRHFERWGMRLGRPPPSKGGIDLAALRGPELVTMLRLSTGPNSRQGGGSKRP